MNRADALQRLYSKALERERALHARLTSTCLEIEILKSELKETKSDRHYWWKRSLDLMCKIDEIEDDVPESES